MSAYEELQFGNSASTGHEDEVITPEIKLDEAYKRRLFWVVDEKELGKIKVNNLIIADSLLACAFTHTYLLNHVAPENLKLVGLTGTSSELKIFQTNRDDPRGQYLNELELSKIRKSYIYVVNDASYAVCLLSNQLKSEECDDWVNKFVEHFEFKKAYVITAQSQFYFNGPEDLEFPLVRYVSSEKAASVRDDARCMRLEPTNVLKNLPAAIIAYCEAKEIDFLVFACYTTLVGVDLNSVKTIRRAVEAKLGEKNFFIDNEKSKKTLKSLEKLVTSVSSLFV